MTAEVLEIVQLEGGEVALRKVDNGDAEPVITIRFSGEALGELQDAHLEIARAMIAAGVQKIADARERAKERNEPPVLH